MFIWIVFKLLNNLDSVTLTSKSFSIFGLPNTKQSQKSLSIFEKLYSINLPSPIWNDCCALETIIFSNWCV